MPRPSAELLHDAIDRIKLGAEFTHLTQPRRLKWKAHSTIVRFEPEQEIAFRIAENWVIWSFRTTPLPECHTRLGRRRETPDGISDYSLDLAEKYLGGQQTFTQILRAGMRQTLERIKAAAEQPDPTT